MMGRWLCTVAGCGLLFRSGCWWFRCCSGGPCGPGRGGSCCFCLPCIPKPIVWNGCCNDCGPCPGESCADHCCGGCGPLGQGGLFPWIRNCWSCGRGCSEIYCDEWTSDPPDC